MVDNFSSQSIQENLQKIRDKYSKVGGVFSGKPSAFSNQPDLGPPVVPQQSQPDQEDTLRHQADLLSYQSGEQAPIEEAAAPKSLRSKPNQAPVEEDVAPDSLRKTYKFIPADKMDSFSNKDFDVGMKIVGPEQAAEVTAKLNEDLKKLPAEYQKKIGDRVNGSKGTLQDRLNLFRDQVVQANFNRKPESMKRAFDDYVSKNKLDGSQIRELMAQTNELPPGSVDQVLAYATKSGDPELANQAFKDFGKIFNNEDELKAHPVDVVESVKKINENIKALADNKWLRDSMKAKTSEDLAKLIETNPLSIKNVSSTGYQGLVPLALGSLQRVDMLGTAMLLQLSSVTHDADSLFGGVSRFSPDAKVNADKAHAYSLMAKRVLQDAGASNGSFWVPPRAGFDTMKLSTWLLGGYSDTADVSAGGAEMMAGNWDIVKGSPLKGMMRIAAGYELQGKAHSEYMAKEGISTLEYTGRQLRNLGVTAMGLVASTAASPISYVGKVIKLGAAGAEVMRLGKQARPALVADKAAIMDAMKTIETDLIENVNRMSRYINVDSVEKAADFVVDARNAASKKGFNPFPEHTQLQANKNLIAFNNMSKNLDQVGEIGDEIIRLSTAMKRPGQMAVDSAAIQQQLFDARQRFVDLAKSINKQAVKRGGKAILGDVKALEAKILQLEEVTVNVQQGTQRLSKQGAAMMKDWKKGSPIYTSIEAQKHEMELASRALENPSLVDKGGVKLFGFTIPGTPAAQDAIVKSLGKVPFFNRFPGNPAEAGRIMTKHFREYEGRQLLAQEYVSSLKAGMTTEDGIRLSLAIEYGQTDKLGSIIKINEHGTLQDIAKLVRQKLDDVQVEAMMANKELVDKLVRTRGMTPEAAYSVLKKNGGDLMGDYIENYQKQMYRNKQSVRQLVDMNKYVGGEAAANPALRRINQMAFKGSAFDASALNRTIPDTKTAYNIFLKNPADHVIVDRAVGDIINGIDVKGNIATLTKLGKDGLDPELGFAEKLFSRLSSSNTAVLKRRMNIDLANALGIPTTMQNYFKSSHGYVAAGSLEFNGVLIPKEVQQAIKTLDSPEIGTVASFFNKQRLENELGGATWKQIAKDEAIAHPSIEPGVLKTSEKLTQAAMVGKKTGLTMLQAYDKVNNWVNKTRTSVWPAFHMRNAVSNVIMNYSDVGTQAFNPTTASNALTLATIGGKGELAKGMIFKNVYGQIISGEDLYAAAKSSGVFTSMGAVADVRGGWAASPLNMMAKAGQLNEDAARLANFASHWKNGEDFMTAAIRGKKMMVDYANLTHFEKEVVGRVLPFYSFFRNNFTNVIETMIKNPERILMPVRAMGIATGSLVKDYSGETGPARYSQMPMYGQEGTDPETGNRTVEQITSTGNSFEDLDRYHVIGSKIMEGWNYFMAGDNGRAADSFGKAANEGLYNLMPAAQIPLAIIDRVTGGSMFRKEKLSPEIAEYLLETPQPVKQMMGFDVKAMVRTAIGWEVAPKEKQHDPDHLVVTYSPIANQVLTALGGSRMIGVANKMLASKVPLWENIQKNLLSPLSRRMIDLDEAKKIKQSVDMEEVKATNNWFKKSIKDYEYQTETLNMMIESKLKRNAKAKEQ